MRSARLRAPCKHTNVLEILLNGCTVQPRHGLGRKSVLQIGSHSSRAQTPTFVVLTNARAIGNAELTLALGLPMPASEALAGRLLLPLEPAAASGDRGIRTYTITHKQEAHRQS